MDEPFFILFVLPAFVIALVLAVSLATNIDAITTTNQIYLEHNYVLENGCFASVDLNVTRHFGFPFGWREVHVLKVYNQSLVCN